MLSSSLPPSIPDSLLPSLPIPPLKKKIKLRLNFLKNLESRQMAQVVKVLAMQAGGPELAPRSHAKSQARWHTLIIAAWEGGARGGPGVY